MGMPTTSIAQNPTSSAPVQQSGGKGAGKGMGSMMPQQTQQMPQQPDQGYRSTIQPSSMTMSATSGQPTMGQPNPYPNTTGSWDNSTTQQPPAQMSGGKGKGA
jgi:hypothetical protein